MSDHLLPPVVDIKFDHDLLQPCTDSECTKKHQKEMTEAEYNEFKDWFYGLLKN